MNPWKYFALAAEAAALKNDIRCHRLGAVGLRSDGTLVAAYNGPAKNKQPSAHAEARLCRKMDYYGTVFVVRRTPNGYGLARPCANCQTILKSRKVERVYYTVGPTEYGVLEFV